MKQNTSSAFGIWNAEQAQRKQNGRLQRGVRRSSSVTKVSLTCPPFMSSGSHGMPFSHLSSASPTSDAPLSFLKAQKESNWNLGRKSMSEYGTHMESRKENRDPRKMKQWVIASIFRDVPKMTETQGDDKMLPKQKVCKGDTHMSMGTSGII